MIDWKMDGVFYCYVNFNWYDMIRYKNQVNTVDKLMTNRRKEKEKERKNDDEWVNKWQSNERR